MFPEIQSLRYFFAIVVAFSVGGLANSLTAEDAKILLRDDFEEKTTVDWQPKRPDPSHASLDKHPGRLTITTQLGSIGGDARGRQTPLTKNLYLVANPVEGEGDFVLTTCIESFRPTMKYQQAGVLVYDDDDNYAKYDLEAGSNWVGFKFMRESKTFRLVNTDSAFTPTNRIWMRLIKRGNVYERAFSTDGMKYTSAGDAVWGNGRPTWVGIVAINGSQIAEEIEAQFDFFEIRELNEEERQNEAYQERQQLAGSWTVSRARVSGKDTAASPIREFKFEGGNVLFSINDQRMQVDYALDTKKDGSSDRSVRDGDWRFSEDRGRDGCCQPPPAQIRT